MHSALLLTILTQSFIATASPLLERATPLSFAEGRPQTVSYDWTAPYVKDFIIHGSCNATQTNVLRRGLEDAVTLAQHAKEHILVHGKKSPIYQKYYGALPTGAVIGWFDTIATANRAGVIFRCDDPDKKCATENRWAGHWRGKDAPSETVICDVSFFERLPLEDLCSRGYKISTGKLYSYWGADLIHRMFHVDIIGQNAITHASHGYQDTLKLAAGQNYTQTATNTDSLIYFAVEAYAFDISVPGEGCAGQAPSIPDTISIPSTSPNMLPDTIVIPSPEEPEKKAEPEALGKNCHTHDDGEVHCV